MSWIVSGLLAVALVTAAASVLVLRALLRATAGASSLRERIDLLFRLPRRARPLDRGHYFRAYWEGR